MNGDIAYQLFENWLENTLTQEKLDQLTFEQETTIYRHYEQEILEGSADMADYINDQINDR